MAVRPIYAARNLGVAPSSNSESDAAPFAESSTRIKQSNRDAHTDDAQRQASLLAAFGELTSPKLAPRPAVQPQTPNGAASLGPRRMPPFPGVSRLPPGMPPLPVSAPRAAVAGRKLTPPPLPIVPQDSSRLAASQPRQPADVPPLTREAPPLTREAPPLTRGAPPLTREAPLIEFAQPQRSRRAALFALGVLLAGVGLYEGLLNGYLHWF